MHSESVGRTQYQGIAFIATIICRIMALFEGIASAVEKAIKSDIWEQHGS